VAPAAANETSLLTALDDPEVRALVVELGALGESMHAAHGRFLVRARDVLVDLERLM
jgi:hypothetical protein